MKNIENALKKLIEKRKKLKDKIAKDELALSQTDYLIMVLQRSLPTKSGKSRQSRTQVRKPKRKKVAADTITGSAFACKQE